MLSLAYLYKLKKSKEFMKQSLSLSCGRKLRESYNCLWLGFHYASSIILKMFAISGHSKVIGCIVQTEHTCWSPESP